ncbi:MAG: hypothetical protein MJY92_04865 [Bacteroidales bacterium]|nr:hypothetical protein [Bacteroidales bacterium]
MLRKFFIQSFAALAMVLYLVSFIGISVHSCSCTGHVCVSLASHQHHEHQTEHHCCHNHVHHHCSAEHSEKDCCHNDIYRLAISGDSDHNGDSHVAAPQVEAITIFTPYLAPSATASHHSSIFARAPSLPRDVIHEICVLRV